MKRPASSRLPTYVVVVRINGSHLIKNYLITFLALIRYAWFSLSRAPRLPPSLLLSAHLASILSPLYRYRLLTASASTVSYTLFCISTLRSHLFASEISALVEVPCFFLLVLCLRRLFSRKLLLF